MQRYSARKGVAHLNHSPCSQSASASASAKEEQLVIAVVDVTHALGGETFQDRDLQVGSWINVVGYLTWGQDEKAHKHKRRQDKSARTTADQRTVSKKYILIRVQAIMIWSAGSLRLDRYEKAVRMRMQSECEAR